MPTQVDKLLWGEVFYEYKNQGCSQTFDYQYPAGITDDVLAVEAIADKHRAFTRDFLAAALPEGVKVSEARVGFHGNPPDGMDALPGYAYGLRTVVSGVTTYRFNPPNDMNLALNARLGPAGGVESNFWFRSIADDDVVDNFFQQYPAGYILVPGFLPAVPVYTDTKVDIITKILQAVMFYTVQGKKNPNAATPGQLPFIINNWRRATLGDLTTKKWGRPRTQKPGRARAYS